MKKMILLILLTISLSGCGNAPKKIVVNRKLFDAVHMACYQHEYTIDPINKTMKKTGKTIEVDLMACHKMVGFSPEDWGYIRYLMQKLFYYIDRK